jgi:hypothetical protein
MKKYIRATTYNRETVIDRLRSISGIHIVSANDEYVVFRDADNKEYSIQYSYNPDVLDNLFKQLEQEASPYRLVDPSDLTPERLATIVSTIADTTSNDSLGSTEQMIRIADTLRFYNIIR